MNNTKTEKICHLCGSPDVVYMGMYCHNCAMGRYPAYAHSDTPEKKEAERIEFMKARAHHDNVADTLLEKYDWFYLKPWKTLYFFKKQLDPGERGLWSDKGDILIGRAVGEYMEEKFWIPVEGEKKTPVKPDQQKLINQVTTKIIYHPDTEIADTWPAGDRQKSIVCFYNGIYDLDNEKFTPGFRKKDYVVTTLAVAYLDKRNTSGLGQVGQLMQEWVDDPTILYQIIGLCMIRDMPVQKMFILLGKGQDGKSTFINLIGAILGKTNYAKIMPQTLARENFAACDLFNKLANLPGDVPGSAYKDTAILKQLTGNDDIRADRKHLGSLTFSSYATMVAACNKLPKTNDDSDGFIRRQAIIRFKNQIPLEKIDNTIDEKIRNPQGDFLISLINVAMKSIEELIIMRKNNYKNLMVEGSINKIREEYLLNENPIQAFIENYCRDQRKYEYSVTTAQFKYYLEIWGEKMGIPEDHFTFQKINKIMADNGIHKIRSRDNEEHRNTSIYSGIVVDRKKLQICIGYEKIVNIDEPPDCALAYPASDDDDQLF